MTIDTIPANDRRETFTATGGQTLFPYDFPVYDATHLEVRRIRAGVETVLALITDYTVSGAGEQAGGNVTLTTGATAGDTIVIRSNQPASRATSFGDSGDLPAGALNAELNRLWIWMQQLELRMNQVVRVDPGDPTVLAPIGRAAARANKFIGFDGTGLNVVFGTLTVGTTTVTPTAAALLDDGSVAEMQTTLGISSFVQGLLDDLNAAAARTTLGAAGSGDIAASGLTIPTGRLAGRTTAGTGALEGITPSSQFSLAAGVLSAPGLEPITSGVGGALGNLTAIVAGTGAALVLPAGGTWGYSFIAYTAAGAITAGSNTGISAGGSTIAGPTGGVAFFGWAKRIT
jgi:hypothetical protein